MTDKTYDLIELIGLTYKDRDKLYVTSTTGGTHATGSYHYRAEAVDFGSGGGTGYAAMDGYAAWWYQHPGYLSELIHTRAGKLTGWFVKNGRRFLVFYSLTIRRAHRNHVHVAIASRAQAWKLLVLRVQQLLGVKADGIKGPVTTNAIKKFQTNTGLKVDGVIGPKTLAMMRHVRGWKPVTK